MLIYAKAPLFLWAEVVATACYTQNQSIIQRRHGKTPFELLHDRKPKVSYLHVFGALCYPNNDSKDLGKLQAKADIGIFIGYAPKKKAYRPGLQSMTPATSSSGLVTNLIPQQPCNPSSRDDWDHLFQPMFDEYFNPSTIDVSPVLVANAPRVVDLADSPVSTSIDQDTQGQSTGYRPHDSNVIATKHDEMNNAYSFPNFIANCFITDSYKYGDGVIDLKKSLTLQDLTKPSSFQKKRKGIVEHELEQFIDGLYCNRALHEGVSFRDKIKALSVRIPESPRLVKRLDELIKKREDMHFFLNKKAILESIGMEVEEKLKKEIL
ncbi:retrovirus-related pol polyprotein from transposon TNT 1-94 [Tanacetum coccineum]